MTALQRVFVEFSFDFLNPLQLLRSRLGVELISDLVIAPMYIFNPCIPLLEIIDVFERDKDYENATSIHLKMVSGYPAMAIDDA